MSRDTRIRLLATLVLAASLLASGGLTVALSGMAGRYKLVYTDRAEEGQTWEVSAGIAMGAFRGIFVNWLWMRANDMKEDGKYYEAVELARAITKLQPRFPRVWVFHAWNLAYNISVMTNTAEERWQWVNAGIRLLRDEGIPANPNDMLLHKELAWIYIHKICEWTDDANQYYKRRFAAEWTINLGEPPAREPADRDRDHAIAKYVAWLKEIADAPSTEEELAKRNPKAATLLQRIKEAGVKSPQGALDRYETYTHLLHSSHATAVRQHTPEVLAGVARLVEDPGFKDAWTDTLHYLRRAVLTDVYHMEPDRMIRYTEKFGPLDWRSAAAHSLYWSMKGVEVGTGRWYTGNAEDFDFLNTDRIVVQSVQELFRYGDVYFDFTEFRATQSSSAMLLLMPNPHFVKPYGDMLTEVEARSAMSFANVDDKHTRGYRPMAGGYENFLRDAVCFFYARGDRRNAEYWLRVLRTWPGANLAGPKDRADYTLPLDDFVVKELSDRVGTPNVAVSQITGSLVGAYAVGLLGGDLEMFQAQFEYAKKFHAAYFERQYRTTNVDINEARMGMMPKDFRELAGAVFAQFISSLNLENAEIVYGRASNDLRLSAYDTLHGIHQAQVEAQARDEGGRSFEQIFPPPQGIEAFRAEQKRRELEQQQRENSAEKK